MSEHDHRDDKTATYRLLSAGTTVGQYDIIERIGAGGMGDVYLAQDNKLKRRVALKFLSLQFAEDSSSKERFTREAQAAARLNHPNIVTIYEVGEFRGQPFIAMEYINGYNLHNHAHGEPLPIKQVLELAAQICEGLEKAHQEMVIHRDIKTGNVMIEAGGRAKILDFGLATIQGGDKLTKVGSTVGTMAYMSPEQAQGGKIDQRSDLFSLGILLYELVAGRTPFKRDSEASTLQAVLNDFPEPLARFKSGVPEGLQRIIDKLLDKDPAMRYQTASDVGADLLREKRLIDSGVSSGSSPVIAGVGNQRRRNGKRTILSVSAAMVVIILTLVLRPWQVELQSTAEATPEHDRLAVMYFDNLADPTDSLRLGQIVADLLITDLSGSRQMRVLSSQRLYDLLKQFGKEGARTIDRATATQVADQAKARWMLTGSILQLQPRIVITTQLIDVRTGQIEASERSTALDGEELFAQIDRLTTAIRGDLAVPDLMAGSDGGMQAMTHSPEAYRLYLEGIELNNKLYRANAKKNFERAIELDSTFGMAYYKLALNWSDGSDAEDHIRKAVKYTVNASNLQRMYIIALADRIAGDIDAAIVELEKIIAEYPDEKEAHAELAHLYNMNKRDLERSLYHNRMALAIDPQDKTTYNNLAYSYKDLRQYDSALSYIDQYMALVPDEPNPYDSHGEIAAAAGDFALARQSYRQALAKDPGFENAQWALTRLEIKQGNYAAADSCIRALIGDVDKSIRSSGRSLNAFIPAHQGRFAEALRLFNEGIATDRMEFSDDKGSFEMGKHLGKIFIFELLGQNDSALIAAEVANRVGRVRYPDRPLHYQDLRAAALAQSGKIEEAERLLKSIRPSLLNSGFSVDKANFYHAEAKVAMAAGDYHRAIEILTGSLNLAIRTRRPRGEYLLATAYLGAGQPESAIPLLERGISSMESVFGWIPMYGAKAHYLLGQAYEHTNQTTQAIEQYDIFLNIWKDADPGIKEIADARKRLSQLRQPS